MSPEAFAQGTAELRVEPRHCASALASAPGESYPEVFATTQAIALCELAAGRVLQPLLKPGQLSVGVDVHVRHTAATLPGSTARAEARFVGMEGKLYAFEVRVFDEGGEVMNGRHTRAIIDESRLLAGAQKRRG